MVVLYHNRKSLMYRLRTDGFVSLNAGFRTGTLLTRILKRRSGELSFNVSTSEGGAFRVEVCDEKGTPLPGYAFSDMQEFYGDSIDFIPEWRGRTLADLTPGNFRLRLKMRECDLYSFAVK